MASEAKWKILYSAISMSTVCLLVAVSECHTIQSMPPTEAAVYLEW